MSSAADLTQPTGSAAAATLQPTALLASLLAERASAAPRQVSSNRHMKRLAEGGGEVEGWSSCGGRPPPSAQCRGTLAGEAGMGSADDRICGSAGLCEALGWAFKVAYLYHSPGLTVPQKLTFCT